ncbi:MAG: PD-(D/E)XK nuclease family protein, partial [Thermoplasmatota archaeon]
QPKVHAPVKYSAHSIIDTSQFERPEEGLGMEYGTKVHRFAELYAEGKDIEPTNEDEENIKQFINSLEGELLTEKNCLLPLDIDEKRLLFQGIIDLIHINKSKVQIIDFKTDRDKNSITEYRKQLSIYKKAVEGVHPEKNIESYVFYTEDGDLTRIEPMNLKEINQNLRT